MQTQNLYRFRLISDDMSSYRASRNCFSVIIFHDYLRELLHHGRGAGEEEMTEIEVVSGETTLILHIETYQL